MQPTGENSAFLNIPSNGNALTVRVDSSPCDVNLTCKRVVEEQELDCVLRSRRTVLLGSTAAGAPVTGHLETRESRHRGCYTNMLP